MLKFDKATHSYKNTFTDLEYVSATTLINKFKKKFDSDFYSKKIAEKEGISSSIPSFESKKVGNDVPPLIERSAKSVS